MIYFVIFVFCSIVITAYVTARICNHEHSSSWQVIRYVGNSVVPVRVYICKHCRNKVDEGTCYCSNCGYYMTNGTTSQYYSDEINIGEELSE